MNEAVSENEKLISYVTDIADLTKINNIVEKRFYDFIDCFAGISDTDDVYFSSNHIKRLSETGSREREQIHRLLLSRLQPVPSRRPRHQ